MIIHPRYLLFVWAFISTIAFLNAIWIGRHAALAGVQLWSVLRDGYAIRYLDALAVCGGLLVAVLCLLGSIYAAWKIRELLEG